MHSLSAPSLRFLRLASLILLLPACGPAGSSGTPPRAGAPIAEVAAPAVPRPVPAAPVSEVRPDLKRHFDTFAATGAFVLYDMKGNRYVRYNPERCAEGFLPASTFKIFNSLVALETGVVRDENEIIKWDGVRRRWEKWNEDLDMKLAFSRSAVWFYQELARRIGAERMGEYLRREGYGNMNSGGGIDHFWLDGDLRISADQQIEFLRKLHAHTLGFSERAMRIVNDIMVIEKGPDHTLRGKTGWATGDFGNIGWQVGYVEKGEDVYFYATNIASPDPDFPMKKAQSGITTAILVELGALPPPAADR